MKLLVVSPQEKNEYSVQWIEAHTVSGSIIIQQGHAPMIITLIPGSDLSFMLDDNSKKTVHLTRSGFLQVDRNSATALISQEI